ncbi:hypothetical protein CDL15_Pgr001214 [Punica granatum]|uniref:Uncharacterized protein n=1 Tax=Punica granatum TaxID=22663 RepID=A0A218WL51_PUNGR|nr:hypothetical protein CDL15_Pgr001214 [Punica granatum]
MRRLHHLFAILEIFAEFAAWQLLEKTNNDPVPGGSDVYCSAFLSLVSMASTNGYGISYSCVIRA